MSYAAILPPCCTGYEVALGRRETRRQCRAPRLFGVHHVRWCFGKLWASKTESNFRAWATVLAAQALDVSLIDDTSSACRTEESGEIPFVVSGVPDNAALRVVLHESRS